MDREFHGTGLLFRRHSRGAGELCPRRCRHRRSLARARHRRNYSTRHGQ